MGYFTDDIQARAINLCGRVNSIAPDAWASASASAGESRTQEMFVADVMSVYQMAVTANLEGDASLISPYALTRSLSLMEEQFNKILTFLPAGARDAANNLPPFTQGPVTPAPASTDVSGYWGGVFKDGVKNFLRGAGVDLNKLRPPGISQETFDNIVVYSIAAIIGWIAYKIFIK